MRVKLSKEEKEILDTLNADYTTEKQQGVTHVRLKCRESGVMFGHGQDADEHQAIRLAIADGQKATKPKTERQRIAEYDKMEKELEAAKKKLAELSEK